MNGCTNGLLTADGEIELAKKIEEGRIASEKLKKINPGEFPAYRKKQQNIIKTAHQAEEELILSNTRLVTSIAKRYLGRGVEYEDLIQEGIIGLMRAVRGFEYKRGNRFSTYATWWIRQSISRAVADQGRLIRIPVHMGDHIRTMNKVIANYQQTFGKNPSDEELMGILGINKTQLKLRKDATKSIWSLNGKVDKHDPESIELEDIFPAPLKFDNMSEADYNLFRQTIGEIVGSLNPREEQILNLRFNLDGRGAHTLEETGQKLGITRERTRQIQSEALKKIKPQIKKRLAEYC